MNSPDIILFMIDQCAAKWFEIGLAGEVCRLPNFRKLAARGVTFSHAFTSNPVCCPARCTIATGMTSRGHGVLENGYGLDPELPTFMKALQQGGYRTGLFGKGHFRPHFESLSPDYRAYGFDVAHVTEDPRGGEYLDWVKKYHPNHYDAVLATVWSSYLPSLSPLAARIDAIRTDFSWSTAKYPANDRCAYTLPFPEEVSQTNWITMHALEFIDSTPSRQPYFAQISYVQPHNPGAAPERFADQVDPQKIPPRVPAEWAEHRADAPGYFSDKQPISDGNWFHNRLIYFADLMHLDEMFGRVWDAVVSRGNVDNTAIIFTSDHGDLLFDHGCTGKEERHYDSCLRIPLIVSAPGMGHGEERDELVQLEDICPTILELSRTALERPPVLFHYLKPEEFAQMPETAGFSLLHPVQRHCAYSESYNPIWSMHPGDWARTVRTKRYRYTRYFRNGEQLFDLEQDPDEQRNLSNCAEYRELRNEMRDLLLDAVIAQDWPKTRRNLSAFGTH